MLDILSIALGAIGILQNIDSKQTLATRIGRLERALEQIGHVHKCLEEAKEIHDQFEKLTNIGLKSELEGIQRNRNDRNIVLQHMRNLVAANDQLIRTRSVMANAESAADLNNTPISRSASKLVTTYPELRSALHDYLETVEALKSELAEENTGRKVDSLMELLTSQTSRVSANADEAILNIVPVTQFLHYEVVKFVKDLK